MTKTLAYDYPNAQGRYGEYGGQFVPETLMSTLKALEISYNQAVQDPKFIAELNDLLKDYVGRENPLYLAKHLTEKVGGAKIYLKREDLNHTGAHKINNALGQGLLTKYMGKSKIIAETGAGQHGVAAATAAALLGLECTVFMGEEDVRRQSLNVFRMKLLGATVHSVTKGNRTLKDATNEALRFWVANVEDTHYMIGSAMGPHPFPKIVRDFQTIIGKETRAQILEKEGKLPHSIVACVGGGSNAIGMFTPFIQDESVNLHGVEAAGKGVDTDDTAATISIGKKGYLHGAKMYLLQDDDGQVQEAYSISAGLDYPGVGPEHGLLNDIGRVTYHPVTDDEAVDAFVLLSQTEGIIPAIESAHAVSYAVKLAATLSTDDSLVICLSGRGDKDVQEIQSYLEAGQGGL